MTLLRLENNRLNPFLEKLGQRYALWAPGRGPEGWRFEPVEDSVNLDGYLLTRLSAKQFVLPLYETLLRFDGSTHEPDDPKTAKRLIFGVRPCDARAVRLMNRVYLEADYTDPHYKNRFENTVFLVIACHHPAPTCFCTSTGGGPSDEYGADIMAYPIDNGWLFKTVTPKGAEVLKNSGLEQAGEPEIPKMPDMPVTWDLGKIRNALETHFDNNIWNTLADRCLACGTCTFVCPSCSCFDVSDEARVGKGRRYRFWDGCMFPLFTHHASGHNPREAHSQRYRQRVMHKFNYFPARNDGLNLCVGCGRCVMDCPVNIDIREAVNMALDAE